MKKGKSPRSGQSLASRLSVRNLADISFKCVINETDSCMQLSFDYKQVQPVFINRALFIPTNKIHCMFKIVTKMNVFFLDESTKRKYVKI